MNCDYLLKWDGHKSIAFAGIKDGELRWAMVTESEVSILSKAEGCVMKADGTTDK